MTSNQLDFLSDSRFNYTYDNPFVGPTRKECLEKLKEYIINNIKNFKSVDWVEDSRCYNIPLKKAFNEDISKSLSDNERLCYYTSNFLNNINSKLSKPLIPRLYSYVQNHLDKPEEESEEEVEEKKEIEEIIENEKEEDVYFESTNDAFLQYQQLPNKHSSSLNMFSYDARPGKTLTYEEVCNLTLNLARSQLQNIIKKDESVIFAESREKNRLITELNKYLKNSEIATKLNLQPDNLTIPQLQQSVEQAKDLYNTIKVTHVIEKGLDLFNLGYTYAFPNGIKIPKKNKAIKLNGITGTFKQLLFDRTSPLNIAFKNILEKHHISISDEFVVGLSSVEAIMKKIEIVDIEPEKDSKSKVESVTETEDDDSKNNEDEGSTSTEAEIVSYDEESSEE